MNTITTEKITKKMRFEALQDLIGVAEEMNIEGFNFAELNAFCMNEIELLDRKSAKAKERAAKAKEETDDLKDMVYDVLTPEFMTKDEVVEAVQKAHPDYEKATAGRIVNRLATLVREDVVEKGTATIGETGAKHKVVVYRLIVE